MFNFFQEKIRRLIFNEDGQSLIFGVLSVFIVLFFGAMVLGVGRVTARRVQMQHAADSAAYAAASVESEALTLIASLNTAMARIRGQSMRYLTDVYTYGTLNALREKMVGSYEDMSEIEDRLETLRVELRELEDRRDDLLRDLDDPDLESDERQHLEDLLDEVEREIQEKNDEIEYRERVVNMLDGGPDAPRVRHKVGIERADLAFEAASREAETWIEAAGPWMESLSRLQHTVTILAPQLSAEAAYRAATRQGAQYVSQYPASRWFPREDGYLDVRAERTERPEGNWWNVEGGGERISVRRISCSTALDMATDTNRFCADCQRAWVMEWRRGTQSSRYLIVELEAIDGHPDLGQWYWENLDSGESRCIRQTEDYRVVTHGPDNVDVVDYDGFRAIINTDGEWPDNTMFVRDHDGTLEVSTPPQDADPEWEPADDDFSPLPPVAVNVDGVRVEVSMDPVIPLPGETTIRVVQPSYIDLRTMTGERWARVRLRAGRTHLTASINGVDILVRDGRTRFRRRGQSFHTDRATGQWRTNFDHDERYWWQHRLTHKLDEPSHDKWLYQYEEKGGMLKKEDNIARMAAHHSTDGVFDGNSGGWVDDIDLPAWTYEPDHSPGGWLNIQNAMLEAAEDGAGYNYNARSGETYQVDLEGRARYHQVRECWESRCESGQVWNEDEEEYEECETCEGEGYVLVDASEVEWPRDNPGRRSDLVAFFDKYSPLVLDEEFLKHGVTVGVWSPRESHFGDRAVGDQPDRPLEYLLHDPEAGMRGVVEGRGEPPRQRGERLRPAWGYFTVAAARPRLMAGREQPAEPGRMQQGWFFDESAASAGYREEWIEEHMWNLYLADSAGEWSYWDAKLVPVNKQLLDHDIREIVGAESGTGYLMQRIAYGSPGGLTRTRHTDTPSWWGYERHFGDISGWTKDIFGGYDRDFPPGRVRERLLEHVRPREPYPRTGPAYIDPEYGTLRDPLMEYLADSEHERGGQLDYRRLRPEDIQH